MTPQQIRRLYPEVDNLPYDLGILQRRANNNHMTVDDPSLGVRPIQTGDGSAINRLAIPADTGLRNFKRDATKVTDLSNASNSVESPSSSNAGSNIVDTAYIDRLGEDDGRYRRRPVREFSSINFINSLTVSSAVKIAAFAAVGFYIYKSVKDGGVQTVEGGPKRNIFKWVDAAGGLIIAIYLFNMAKSTLTF